ncbi:Single-stranded DNA-binding protein 3 [Bagarius yarrelli]|uniref:Single-stranded DNA-binding protein 3 n=1 Tax=Bagarius yarrelli TaxID=175774 RepID=A0A556U5A8_BAGYA|nr:Single-stranded DNA-binding protein 3 [Bagarius yarrelli]
MYSKSVRVPSDSQAREKLALYVYEYLLHVGAQKSAQTFLSEIRWEKNVTLGEPPGFLHSWWCVFWDLYCAAPERRETCEHSGEAKAFHDYVSDLLMQFMSPRCPGGPRAPLRMPSQVQYDFPSEIFYRIYKCGESLIVKSFIQTMGPGNQPLLSGIDPMRQSGPLHMNGPMQRMMAPRGMIAFGPQNLGGGMRPSVHSLMGSAMPGMAPGGGRSWLNPSNSNTGLTGSGGGAPETPVMPSPAVGGVAGIEAHPLNGSLELPWEPEYEHPAQYTERRWGNSKQLSQPISE